MITINGTSIRQPSTLNEYDVPVQTTAEALDGSRKRDKRGQKVEIEMSWTWLRPTDYRQLRDLFISGNTVNYVNTESAIRAGDLSFTGLPEFEEDEYLPGSSLVKPLTVTIREA